MFSLSYSRAYDPYHTIYRILCLLIHLNGSTGSANKLRYLDFYLCFPWLIEEIQTTRKVAHFLKSKNAVTKLYQPTAYNSTPASRTLFERMEIIYSAAISAASKAKIVTLENNDKITLNAENISDKILIQCSNTIISNKELFDFLCEKLSALELHGEDGIKSKTGLSEYRYDDV